MHQGDWDGAFAMTQAALQATPTIPKLHAYLGLCYFRKSDFASAEGCFRRAVTLDPHYWEAGAKLAQCLDRLYRREEAFTVAKQFLKVNPSDRTLQGIVHALEHQVKGHHQEGWERSRNLGTKIEINKPK